MTNHRINANSQQHRRLLVTQAVWVRDATVALQQLDQAIEAARAAGDEAALADLWRQHDAACAELEDARSAYEASRALGLPNA